MFFFQKLHSDLDGNRLIFLVGSWSVFVIIIGEGMGRIRNIAISNITVSGLGVVFCFMTHYFGEKNMPEGEAVIENINISNVMVENTQNKVDIFADL